jgi:hypothetical protein
MIVEVRTYTLKPGNIAQYLQLYQSKGLQVQSGHLGRLLGYFVSEFGELNQIVHMWAYEDHADRERRRTSLFRDAQWLAVVEHLYQMIDHMENRILTPTSFSPDFLPRAPQ